MFCPLIPSHVMVEIAPELYQCPKCGAGPREGGRFPFWSLSCVEIFRHRAEGLAIKFDPRLGIYIVSDLEWSVDDDGRTIGGTVVESLVEYISTTAEKAEAFLPVITELGSGCSQDLSPGMFQNPEGEKVI